MFHVEQGARVPDTGANVSRETWHCCALGVGDGPRHSQSIHELLGERHTGRRLTLPPRVFRSRLLVARCR